MRLLLDAADDDHRLAKVGLGMTERMRQQHKHLAAEPFALSHVILHDRVAPGKGIQLRSLDRCRPPIPGRNRKRHHLGYAVARDVEMPRRLTLAHALSTGQPNLPIQIPSENPPALPVTRKGKGGRLLHRPQQAHPAATVADFRTAVLRPHPFQSSDGRGRQSCHAALSWETEAKNLQQPAHFICEIDCLVEQCFSGAEQGPHAMCFPALHVDRAEPAGAQNIGNPTLVQQDRKWTPKIA